MLVVQVVSSRISMNPRKAYASYLISVGVRRAPIGSHVLELLAEFPDQTASAATHPRTATTLIASAPFTALSASRSTVGLLHSVRCDSP